MARLGVGLSKLEGGPESGGKLAVLLRSCHIILLTRLLSGILTCVIEVSKSSRSDFLRPLQDDMVV